MTEPRKVTVVDENGKVLHKRVVGDEEGFQRLLKKFEVKFLRDEEDFIVADYAALQEGVYTLGDKIDEPVPTIDLELSLGNKKTVKLSWSEGKQTMAELEQLTRDRFGILLAQLAFALPNGASLDSDEKLQEIPPNTSTKVAVTVTRVGFSSILTVKDALKLLGKAGDSIPIDDSIFPPPREIKPDHGELLHAVSTLERLHNVAPLPQGCPATRRLYIDPILLASARLVGDVLIQVEKVYESKDVHGPIDYVFKFGDQTLCVTEGKKDDIDRGVIQNVAQLSTVSRDRDRKRKISEISTEVEVDKPIYGIATTYLNWSFLVLSNGVVTQSSIHGIKDADKSDVGGIIGRIVAILERMKSGG